MFYMANEFGNFSMKSIFQIYSNVPNKFLTDSSEFCP